MVSLLGCSERDTAFCEDSLQLALILALFERVEHRSVRSCGDAVGMTEEGDFIRSLGYAGGFERCFQCFLVVCAWEYMVTYGLRTLAFEVKESGDVEVLEVGGNVRGCQNGIDVVFRKGGIWREGQARPNDAVRIKGRQEECQGLGGDVVGEGAIWKGNAGKVEERTALSSAWGQLAPGTDTAHHCLPVGECADFRGRLFLGNKRG